MRAMVLAFLVGCGGAANDPEVQQLEAEFREAPTGWCCGDGEQDGSRDVCGLEGADVDAWDPEMGRCYCNGPVEQDGSSLVGTCLTSAE